MGYAVKANVSIISGIPIDEIDDYFLTIADNQVNSILNRTFGDEIQDVQFYDVDRKNDFFVDPQFNHDISLSKYPVLSINHVKVNDSELTVDSEYWMDSDKSVLSISNSVFIPAGQKKVEISYVYGYETVPSEIIDFANFLASHLLESMRAIAVNSTGNILSEVEIGRYREKYANPTSYLKGKYGSFLGAIQSDLINKYKLWL
jgi:hypothetical protein